MTAPQTSLFSEEVQAGAGAARLRKALFELEQRGHEPREGYASPHHRRAAPARLSRTTSA